MGKPIPEAVRVLVAELDEYLRGCPDPDKTTPKWMVRRPSRLLWQCRDTILALTVAQQQGQAVACTCPSGDGSLRWPCPSHPPSAPVGVEGVRRYLAARDAKPIRGMDPEVIHAVHTGTEWEAELRMSDLRALAQQPAAVDEAGKVSVRESALRYCIRELNGARRGDNAEGRAELVHHVLTAWLDLATQHQEPTT